MFQRITVALMQWVVVIGIGGVLPVSAETTAVGDRVVESVTRAVETRQTTQKEEEAWRNEQRELAAAFDLLQQEQQLLSEQEARLMRETAAAEARIAEKEKELADSREISDRIDPFLRETVDRLRRMLSDGLPFLMAERRQRIDRLAQMMEEPEVAMSEKLRKVMEALQVEAEYGNTIDVDQQSIPINGVSRQVNIFRLGRISLFYQTLDRKECGFFDVAAGAWQPLPPTHVRDIQIAVEIGAKRRPVELLRLPLGRMAAK